MPRRPRCDIDGVVMHVFNRAIARRTFFETRHDKRMFMALLARAVHRNEIEVLCFSILTTHYHLMIRGIGGNVKHAMRSIQSNYSRYFNRSRKRDGPLARGRYASRVVDSETYFNTLLFYIDFNPVDAGIVSKPSEYEFGSAYEGPTQKTPIWLADAMRQHRGQPRIQIDFNEQEFSIAKSFIQAQGGMKNGAPNIDELFRSTRSQVIERFGFKSQLADGTDIAFPVCPPDSIRRIVCKYGQQIDDLPRDHGCGSKRVRQQFHCVMLRTFSGATLDQIASRVECSRSTVGNALRDHRSRFEEDADYRTAFASIAHELLQTSSLRKWSAQSGHLLSRAVFRNVEMGA